MGIMKSRQNPSRHVFNWSGILPPLLFGLAALVLRLWHLDAKSVWLDEAFTAYHSTFSALDLWTQPISNKPPLFYLITSLFWSPGDSAFALRLPVAMLGALSVSLSWYLGKALGGVKVAFALALLVLLSDTNIAYSQEARHYMLLSVGWLLLAIAILHMIKSCAELPRPRAPDLMLFGAGALVMIHSHPVAMQYVTSSAIAYAGALAATGRLRWAYLVGPLVVGVLAGMTILPWIPVAMGNASESFQWLKQPHPAQAFLEFMSLFGAKNLVLLGGKGLAIGVGLALVVISLAGILHFMLRRNRPAGVFILGLFLLPPLLIWATGFFKPVYMLRTITPSHLMAMTGLALAVIAFPRRAARTIGTTVLAVVLAISTYAYFAFYKKEAWRGLTQQLQAQMTPDDVVLICEKYLDVPLWFYLGDRMPPLIYINERNHRARVKLSNDASWVSYRKALTAIPPPAVWVVNRYGHCPPAMDRIVRAVTGGSYKPGRVWRGQALSLTAYQKIPAYLMLPAR